MKDLCELISPDKVAKFYLPKYYDLCMDEVAEVRWTTAKLATVPLLWNLIDSVHIDGIIQELRFFKGSNTFVHR